MLTESPAETLDPVASAKAAGLRYTGDDRPGITREKRGTDFVYRDASGNVVDDEATIARIRKLAIPPAYENVWICPWPNGHLQATGRDARGRKQYRYHARWRETRDETKFEHMLDFAKALPKIRATVDRDLSRPGLPREKVVAAVVALLESTLIRVGNEEYARENNSYGLTTLRNKHVRVRGSTLRFEFRGKSGKDHAIDLVDKRLARIVARVRDLPGQELFQYLRDDGTRESIDSSAVNDYLHEIAGDAFTAKDFRTWTGTVACAVGLAAAEGSDTVAARKRAINEIVARVASKLGNTQAVCRKSYIHPEVIATYLDAGVLELAASGEAESLGLRAEEHSVLAFLERRARSGDDTATLLASSLEARAKSKPKPKPAAEAERRPGRRSERTARA